MKNNKSLGQHWLKDRAILDEIATLAKQDVEVAHCLEIGPGLGTLTSTLFRQFSQVTAVEFDSRLAHNLPQSFPGKNLTVINQDFLKFDLSTIKRPYAVAGNIPYYITSPIISKLLESTNPPAKITLLIQKEVAERIVAEPGRHTVLSLTVQNYATAKLEFYVAKDYFTPPPKVDSAVITLVPRKKPLVSDDTLKLIQRGFTNPRKKLIKNLPFDKTLLIEIFNQLQLDPNARPANLSHQDWQNLHKLLSSHSK